MEEMFVLHCIVLGKKTEQAPTKIMKKTAYGLWFVQEEACGLHLLLLLLLLLLLFSVDIKLDSIFREMEQYSILGDGFFPYKQAIEKHTMKKQIGNLTSQCHNSNNTAMVWNNSEFSWAFHSCFDHWGVP